MDVFRKFIFYVFFVIADFVNNRKILSYFKVLKKNEKLSNEELNRFRIERLRKILVYAYENIPFYKEEFDDINFNPYKFSSLKQFEKLPLIDKEIVRNNYDKFICENYRKNFIKRKTGGSTGDKLIVYYDQDSLDITAAANLRCLNWIGKNIGDKEIHFSSNIHLNMPWKDRLKERLKCFVLNRKNIYLDFSNKEKLEKILDEIKKYRPKLIQGFPSFAYELACFAEKNEISCKYCFEIYESTGEVLYSFQKKKIEEIFGCKVFNRYGNAEFGIIAYECTSENVLYILEDIHYVENNRRDNKNNDEIIVTTFTNFAMPLIRYKTGDIGKITNKKNRSLPFMTLENVRGRIHDNIYIDENKKVSTSFILDFLDKYDFINNFQVHFANSNLDILIQINGTCSIDILNELQLYLYNALQLTDVKLNLYLVDALFYTNAGKFRYTVNKMPDFDNKIILQSSKKGSIYYTGYRNIFPKIGFMNCIKGFFDIEKQEKYLFIWSKKEGTVCFDKNIQSLEILNLLEKNIIRFYDDKNNKILEIKLDRGWNEYNVCFDKNILYKFEVSESIPDKLKNNDKRDLTLGFRYLKTGEL